MGMGMRTGSAQGTGQGSSLAEHLDEGLGIVEAPHAQAGHVCQVAGLRGACIRGSSMHFLGVQRTQAAAAAAATVKACDKHCHQPTLLQGWWVRGIFVWESGSGACAPVAEE